MTDYAARRQRLMAASEDAQAAFAAPMNQHVAHRLIARCVRGGRNEASARVLLAEQVQSFSAKNLGCALAYWGFSTANGAERDAAALLEA